MRKQDIEDIKLGPRQLTFDFEKNKLKEQEAIVRSCIKNQIEKYGHVILDEFVQYVKELHNLSDIAILQYIFWFAEDLEIHFRVDEKILEPVIVKHSLIESIEQSVKIVANESVDNSKFQDVKFLYKELSEEKSFNDCIDQYEFARLLAKKIKDWEITLKSCKSAGQKPFFPYEEEINGCLHFVEKISVKLDSFSLINAFYDKKKEIQKLANDVEKISEFYTQHIDFWKNLIQSFEEFNNNLSELMKDSDIKVDFERLKQILSSSAPYNMITEAKKLLEKMTQRCRITLLAKVDNMISKMKEHLDNHKAGPDLRNKSLYSLRTVKNRVSEANNIESISFCLIDAEEKFDAFWDEIKIYIES